MGELLTVRCTRCSTDFDVDRGFEGLFVRCPSCKHFMEVPVEDASAGSTAQVDIDPAVIAGRPDSPSDDTADLHNSIAARAVAPASSRTTTINTPKTSAAASRQAGERRERVRVACPSCKARLEARPDEDGFIECPKCQAEFNPRFIATPVEPRQHVHVPPSPDALDDTLAPTTDSDPARVGPLGRTFVNDVGMHFVFIPPGSFLMGSPRDEAGRRDDETPHQVRISHGYYMAVTLVSQEQYKAVTGTMPAAFKNRKLPVERVSYADAVEFCQQLTQRENGFLARLKHRGGPRRSYRLPTEAEWEYACRCGQQWPYAYGRRIGVERVNFDGRLPCPGDPPAKYRGSTNFVARFKPNPWGLIDMHGNVLEWCSDWYGEYPTQSILNPVGPSRGTWRVARGGSWHHGANDCRCAARFRVDAAQATNYLGFRVVMEVAE